MLMHLLRVCSKKHGKLWTNRALVLRAISFTNQNALPSTSKSFSKLSKWKLQKNCLKFGLIEMQNILSHWTLLRFVAAVEQLQNILLARKTAYPKASKPVRRSKGSGQEISGIDDENIAEKGTKKPGRMEQQNGTKKKGKQQNENNGLGDDEKESAEKRRLEQNQRSDKEFEDFLKIMQKIFGKEFTDSFANSNQEMFRKLNSDKNEFGIVNIVMASLFVLLIFAIFWTMYQFSSRNKHPQSGELQFPAEIPWNYFLQNVANSGEICQIQINAKAVEQARTEGRKAGHIIVHMNLGAINGRDGLPFTPTYRVNVPNLLKLESTIRGIEEDAGIPYNRRADFQWIKVDTSLLTIIFGLFLLCLFGFPLFFGLRDIKKFGGFNRFSSMMPFKMKIIDTATKEGKKALKVKFRDVAGLHEAKVEISEFVDYLRRPQKYTKLGARLPKGALLTGPPGCGKTLLAKALAAESSVPFININGTEFVEMIGGLGASRVRQLFKTAKSRAPCIIYIDEIEAIGRARKDQSFGGHQEMEQTLNQLLVEMDGMDSSGGIVVIGSTNRADILDRALLRPGRFDRHVSVDLPTLLERRETFDLYLQKIKKENSLTGISHRLAQMTPGFSGADIANVINEAAIHAATEQKKMVQMEDIDYAMEKIIAGPKKRSRVLVEEEREIVAWHESGHALVGWLLEHTEALLKVTIIPRTSATLGFAQYSPRDRKIFTKEELFDRMCMMLGGRAAENVTFGRITTGATNDLEKVTKNAQAMVKWYGMNELVGPLSFIPGSGTDERKSQFMEKPYSKKLGALIDQEVNKLVADAYYSTEKLLKENRDKLDKLAKTLLEKETLNYEDVKKLIGPPRYGDKNVVDLAEQVLPDPMKPDFSI